jgi:hypothetical protein
MPDDKPRLRRREAVAYLAGRHGVPVAVATLAKLATVGGGPEIEYFGRIPLYTPDALDTWAKTKLSGPVGSTAGKRHG